MTYNKETNIVINFENCELKHLTTQFLIAMASIFADFVSFALMYIYNEKLSNGELSKKYKVTDVSVKTTNNTIKLKTFFGKIQVPKIQIYLHSGKKRAQKTISRDLLGISPYYQIPDFMKDAIGQAAALATYRVAHKFSGFIGLFKCSLMSVWTSTKSLSKKIKLDVLKNGTNEFETDGTGVPTLKSGKRGSEIKTLFQRKLDGKLHLIGIEIGKYKDKTGWEKLLKPLKKAVEYFKDVTLCCDGDSTIIESAENTSKDIKIQRDMWHITHQLKYYMWMDKIKKELKSKISSLVYRIITSTSFLKVERRLKILNIIINQLIRLGFKHTATYLSSCQKGLFTYQTNGNKNIYTSKTERSMRTINQRINVGVWSDDGVLNVTKIRLAYYYNKIDVSLLENKK